MNPLYFGTGVSSLKDCEGLTLVLREALKGGIRHFDTAPSYKTEAILGHCLEVLAGELGLKREEYFVQTKIDPWQMQDGRIAFFAEDALKKLRLRYFDSLLVHWPSPDYMDATWSALERLYERGVAHKIGVCNVRPRHIQRMLQKRVPPQIVQAERNPLRTCEGEISLCAANAIEFQAYSPLCKMDTRIKENPRVRSIAQSHQKSVGQVVLRWQLQSGAIPVFTSTKVSRVAEYCHIFDFELNEDEVRKISSLNENFKMYLESCVCPGF